MRKNYQDLLAIFIIIFLGSIFQYRYINEFPSYIHAFAQADRYAIAKGFVNNDLNFFKPETFTLNKQFPDQFCTTYDESITAVDFPIHDYIPAIFMKISGNESPWIYRLYTLLLSFLGLFCLFKTAEILTKNFYKSIFVVVFAATSPVFVYYQSGFLPSIPSLSNAFIGMYFYIRFLKSDKSKDFNFAILFFTIGALARTTFAIPLIAVLGLEFLRIITKKSKLLPKIIPVLLSVVVIMFFVFYNAYLREKFGSVFLNYMLPVESWEQFKEIVKIAKEHWQFHYFSKFHYLLIALSILLSSVLLFIKKANVDKDKLIILFLIFVIFIGSTLFALLMLLQFPDHDYYFLDTFYFPIIMLFVTLVSLIPSLKLNKKWDLIISIVLLIGFSLPLIVNANNSQHRRRVLYHWDRTTHTVINFEGSDEFLDSLNIPQDAKILVAVAYGPNIPFIKMDRKGYAVTGTNRGLIELSLSWDFDYIVTQNNFFLSDIYANYPEFIDKTEVVATNNKITVSKLREVEKETTLIQYLGLSEKTPYFEDIITYDSVSRVGWTNIYMTDEYSFLGKNVGVLKADHLYGLTFKSDSLPVLKEKESILLVNSKFYNSSDANVEIVATLDENGENVYYQSINLNSFLKDSNIWQDVNMIFNLPKINCEDYNIGLYIYNPNGVILYIDDYELRIY